VVLCDRFIDSSLAYQGYARDIGMDDVMSINQFAIQGCMPDLTVLFQIEPDDGLERIATNKREKNRLDLENIQFHEKVYEAYHMLVQKYPERIRTIDARAPIDEVEKAALRVITGYLQNNIKEGS
ncbi:MAG TPA: dTMP kinase, partial [Bacillota bacterium]|nr:dTMP kinase [Bacillota bacterium]